MYGDNWRRGRGGTLTKYPGKVEIPHLIRGRVIILAVITAGSLYPVITTLKSVPVSKAPSGNSTAVTAVITAIFHLPRTNNDAVIPYIQSFEM